MTTETIFLGHGNKRKITKSSELLEGKEIEIGEEVQCPRCGEWKAFKDGSHGKLEECVGLCGLWYGTLGTAIQLTDEDPS